MSLKVFFILMILLNALLIVLVILAMNLIQKNSKK